MVYCTICGTKLEEQWIVCPNCGVSIKRVDTPEMVVIPKQKIIPPFTPHLISTERTSKGKKKKIAIVILLVVGFLGGMSLGVIIVNPVYFQARDDAEYWQNEYNSLLDNYNSLLDNYSSLFGDFQSLQYILYMASNPLTNPDTPTVDELFDFLEIDNTNSFNYTENFMCGDFAVMLMGRAKVMRNWRIRISCMFYSYEFELGWEDVSDPYGSYGHAFNVVLCQDCNDDGIEDWVYIEPQTDNVWVVVAGTDWGIHYEIWKTYSFGDYSGYVWSEPYWVNHYSYFA